MVSTWQANAKKACDVRDASLAKVDPPLGPLPDPLPLYSRDLPKQMLTPREYELTTQYSALELLKMLRSKELTSEELTRAFLRSAALSQYAINCVAEIMWDEAIERAKYLDSLPEPIGPLHGLPISMKGQQGMSTYNKPSHGGYCAWVDKPSEPNPINDILFDSGCVYYVRTTEPQTTMHVECNNNIYGRTVNSYNRNLTCGGSSGGEGAILGFQASVFGVGGDIGGSIRVPAGNNGVYGFKPTTKRLPLSGMSCTMKGNESVLPTLGPLARDRETLNLFMEVILNSEPWKIDPDLYPKKWTPVALDKPLKIAIQYDNGVVRPHPPVIRALKEVADACHAAGMEVVDWVSYKHDKAWNIVSRLYWPDGGAETMSVLAESGEPALPLTEWIINQPGVKSLDWQEFWALLRERDAFRAEHAQHWTATGANGEREVDVILCPIVPGAAPPHDCARYWPYASHWNLLDHPSAIFPVTFVDQEKDKKDENYVPRNADDKFNYDLYTPERYLGAPVSLQLVGRRHFDEKVMAALAAVEKALGRE